MLDYCGEIDLYPMDGDNDNYYAYDNPDDNYNFYNDIGGVGGRFSVRSNFIPDRDYYHAWYHFDRVIPISNGYRVLKNNIWSFIPLKIVRKRMDNSFFSHKEITEDILLRSEFGGR